MGTENNSYVGFIADIAVTHPRCSRCTTPALRVAVSIPQLFQYGCKKFSARRALDPAEHEGIAWNAPQRPATARKKLNFNDTTHDKDKTCTPQSTTLPCAARLPLWILVRVLSARQPARQAVKQPRSARARPCPAKPPLRGRYSSGFCFGATPRKAQAATCEGITMTSPSGTVKAPGRPVVTLHKCSL